MRKLYADARRGKYFCPRGAGDELWGPLLVVPLLQF